MPDEWSQYEVKPQTTAPASGWDQYEIKKKDVPASSPTADSSPNGLSPFQSSQASGYSPAVYTPEKQQEIKQAQLQQAQSQHDALQRQMKAYTDKLSSEDKRALLEAGQQSVDQQGEIKDATDENDHYNYMQSPLGKLQKVPQYLASQATHGGLQVLKGLVHLYDGAMNRNNPMAGVASDIAFDYADKGADLGLTKGDISRIQDGKGIGNKALSAGGMAANFAPTVLGGEALQSPKGMLYLQGLGQGKELTDKIPGLHPLAKEALIQGSGAVNLLLSDLGNSMFGQLPSSVKGKVVTSIAADAIKEAAEKGITSGDGVQQLLQNGAKTFADKLEQGGLSTLKAYTDNVKTFAKLNVGNFALHKGVDAINQAEGGHAVFNETPGDLAGALYKTATQDAPIFSAIPALRSISELSPYSKLKNSVIQSLHENPTDVNITATKQALEEHGKQAGWTPEQIKATTDHVDQIGSVMKSLPKGIPLAKIGDAVDLVQGRNELQKQLEQSTTGRDEALAETPSAHEQLLTDKIDQANDKLRDIASGKKTTYSKGVDDDEGLFFKTFAGKKEEITPERYELENFERTQKQESNESTNEKNGGQAVSETDAEKSIPAKENGQEEVGQSGKVNTETDLYPHPKKPIDEMSSEELYDHAKEVKKYEFGLDKRFFGEEGAKEYQQAQGIANSQYRSASDPAVKKANEIIDKYHNQLTPEQSKIFFGENENYQSPDDIRNIAQKVHFIEQSDNIDELSSSIKNPLLSFRADTKDSEAKVLLKAAARKAQEMGIDPAEMLKQGISKAVEDLPGKKGEDLDGDKELLTKSILAEIAKTSEPLKATELKPIDEEKKQPIVMDEEKYLAINGASRQGIGESALHKNKGNNSDKTWSKMVDIQAKKDHKLLEKREILRQEYNQKVLSGEIRPPTRWERLKATANGNPDNESVQAARKILEKNNIDWEQKGEPQNAVKEIAQQESSGAEHQEGNESGETAEAGNSNSPVGTTQSEGTETAPQAKNELELQQRDAEQPDENLTGIRNADVAKERNENIPRDKMTHEEIDKEGKRLVDSGEINPDEFAKQVISGKKAITAEEEAALLYRKTQLKNRQQAILKDDNPDNNAANQQEYAHNEDMLERNRQATEIAGNVSGRSLGYRRQLMKEDYSLAHLLVRAKLFNGGEEVDAETKAKLAEHAKRIEQLEGKLLDKEEEIRKLRDTQTVAEVRRNTEFENRTARRETSKASLRREREELKAELMHLAAKSRGNIGANKIPFEFLAPMAKLARNYVMDGALSITQVADKIYQDLKDHLPGVTHEDIEGAIKDHFDQYLSEKNAERLAAAKKRQLAKLETLKEGNYEKKTIQKIQVDHDYLKIRAEIAREQTLINKRIADIADSKKSIGQKIADIAVKYGRQAKLASITVLGKLAAAGLTTIGLKPIEELVGAGYSKVLPTIAAKSNVEGGINVRALANSYAKAATEGMKDAAAEMNIKKGGQSDLSALYGKYRATKLPAEAAEFFGHLHSAIKAPFKRAIWEHSYAKRVAKGIENGVDVTEPVIDAKYRLDAYKDGEKAIFMGDNVVSSLYEMGAKYLENNKNPVGRGAGALTRILFPFVKVPSNIVLESLRYAGGLIPGAGKLVQVGASTAARMAGAEKLAKFIHKGMGELTPEESDIVLNNLKKGSVGAAALAIGYFNPKMVGGYYQPGEKRKHGEVEADQIGHLPIWMTEHPIFQAMQIGATYRRLLDAHRHKDDKISAAVLGTAAGIAENIPLAEGAKNITEAMNNPHKLTRLISSTLRGEFEPAVIQQIAQITDTRNHAPVTLNPDNMVKRKPDNKHGMWKYIKQDMKQGIPILRKEVPRK